MFPSFKPVTASWAIGPVLRPPQLAHSIALAVLLHIWLVLVLGSAPGGLARPGEGVWGRVGGVIDVRLSGLLGDKAEVAEPAPPLTRTGPVGAARQERFGGAVRAPAAVEPESTSPGAVRLGRWNSQAGDAQAVTPPNRITALPAAEPVRPLPAANNLSLPPMPIRPPAPPAPPVAPAPAPVVEPTPERPPAPVVDPVPAPAPAPAPAPESALPRVEPTPAASPAPQPTAVQPAPPQTPAATASPGATSGAPAPAPASFPGPAGSPDAGSRVGRDVATPASTPPTAAREPLNLSLPRGAATSRQGASGLLSMVPIPPDRKTKLEQEMEAAAKADCRKAYAGAGLLAAVPLVLDAARDKGCRW